ncbi:MAG: hypothetical protein KF773_14635 [Deltaproteobacteria bacterium]|nr:hypothetical protein [Deltaproteobacteria bacterium]
MRPVLVALMVAACSKDEPRSSGAPPDPAPSPRDPSSPRVPPDPSPRAPLDPSSPRVPPDPPRAATTDAAAGAVAPAVADAPAGSTQPPATDPHLPPHRSFADLATALAATLPADARVIGFGELHARADVPGVRSSLSAFTDALPAFGERISDLVVETWRVDGTCGSGAVAATQRLETSVRRPAATKSEIGKLVDATRAAKIQPHAMTVSCADYDKIAPAKGDVDPIAMLTLTTKELTRIARSAVAVRDKQPGHRPWIALYGGALHNDRFPPKGVEEWSYADAVDKAAGGKYVEVDIVAPELAEADKLSRGEPWFPLCASAKQVLVWQRGERSFVVVLPRTPP